MVALGRVVFTTREHVIAIEPRGKGTLGLTLRNPYVRDEELHFGNITDEKVPKDMLDLAVEIVRSNARHFQPDKFEDHYESALRELIGKKQRGEKIEKARKRPQAQVINLMDAQRRSAEAGRARTQPQRAPPRGQRMPRDRSSTAGRSDEALRLDSVRAKTRPRRIEREGERRRTRSSADASAIDDGH
jgi:DNA end-binding protein Ku